MTSALLNRLAKVEAALKQSARLFSIKRTVVIDADEPEDHSIPLDEIERLMTEGYRPGIDQIVVLREFVRRGDA
jgi:hypothetical protein